jgi:hypothetical protein
VENLILIFTCLVLGFILRRFTHLNQNFSKSLNVFIIYISLPSMILLYIPKFSFQNFSLILVIFPWLLFILSFIFFYLLKNFLQISNQEFTCLVLCLGLGNTSFFGLPMVEYYYGRSMIPYALILDQLGTFLVLSLVGIPFVLWQTGNQVNKKEIFYKTIYFPPFFSIILAFGLIPFSIPIELEFVFKRLADTLVPLAIVSVGYHLEWKSISLNYKLLLLGLGFKLILAPMLFIFLLAGLYKNFLPIHKVTIFEMAMPPMITASILAIEKNQAPNLASSLVSLGIIISFITLFLLWKLLELFF